MLRLSFPPPSFPGIPAALFMAVHLMLVGVQIVGSVWIRKLSPDWTAA